jgi:hypothetical protein
VFIGAEINGVATAAVLDTGSDETVLTPSLAAAAHAVHTGLRHSNTGLSGSFTTEHWLEGNAGLVLQPAYENSHPVARTKTWSIELMKS